MESINKSPDNIRKSHFINIPIEDPNFIQTYISLSNSLKTLDNFNIFLLQKPTKLHLTICTLDLGEDSDKINKVHSILNDINSDLIKSSDGLIYFNHQQFETMGNVSSTRIIYSNVMSEDNHFIKLNEIIHLIIQALVNNNILDKQKLINNHIEYNQGKYKINLHLTLMNVLFLNKIEKKNKNKITNQINATDILNYIKDKNMSSAIIDTIHFSRMRENKLTEKYEMIYSYKLI